MQFRVSTRTATRVLSTLLTAVGVGWLASGSCVVAGCYEDCDPCFQACQCTSTCQNPLVGEGGHAIVVHTARISTNEGGSFVRTLEIQVGPSLEFVADEHAPGTAHIAPGTAHIAQFARQVLLVNSALFSAEPDPKWDLDAVHAFPTHTAVQFVHDAGPYGLRRANSVTLLFDDAGRLLEVTQVVDRSSF